MQSGSLITFDLGGLNKNLMHVFTSIEGLKS